MLARASMEARLVWPLAQPRSPPLFDLQRSALAELVDLRLPAWARPPGEQADGSVSWRRLSPKARARAWVADVRERQTLSLRDPLAPAERRGVLPCRFGKTPLLACEGHVSWSVRNATRPPDKKHRAVGVLAERAECEVPQTTRNPNGTVLNW